MATASAFLVRIVLRRPFFEFFQKFVLLLAAVGRHLEPLRMSKDVYERIRKVEVTVDLEGSLDREDTGGAIDPVKLKLPIVCVLWPNVRSLAILHALRPLSDFTNATVLVSRRSLR